MTFDIKNSKLYGQIMAALVSFFELEPDTATETDVHAKLEGIESLSKLLDKSAKDAVAGIETKVGQLSEKVTALEAQVSDLTTRAEAAEAKLTEKDDRIAELQTETAEQKSAVEKLKEQHKTEVSTLSGKIAALRAGKEKESGNDETTAAAEVGKGTAAEVQVIQSTTLKRLVTRQSVN
jgi:phage I-like protein